MPEVQVVNMEGFLEEVIPVPSCEWRVGGSEAVPRGNTVGDEAGEIDSGDEHPRFRFLSLAEFLSLPATMSSFVC